MIFRTHFRVDAVYTHS